MKVNNIVNKWIRYNADYGILFTFRFLILNRFKNDISYKHSIILSYLEQKYVDLITKYKHVKSKEENLQPNCPIWVCWYQGEANMPPIVKACYASIKKHAAEHSVYLITLENISDFVTIPDFIIEKVKRKQISLTHYSDIIRNKLLSVHGGIWLDATIYLTDTLKGWNLPFYSLKQDKQTDLFFVSQYRWAGYCMGGVKGNIINSFVSDFFEEYHKRHSGLIDYFLIDYIIAVGYRNIPSIRELIDRIPFSNPHIFFLDNNYNTNYNEQIFQKIKEDTNIFKLSWKSNKITKRANSYYEKIIHNSI